MDYMLFANVVKSISGKKAIISSQCHKFWKNFLRSHPTDKVLDILLDIYNVTLR